MTDLLLRRVTEPRADVEGRNDYDVIGTGRPRHRAHLPGNHAPCSNAVDVDAGLWAARGPHADARSRADARNGHAGLRQELASRDLGKQRRKQ